MQFRTIGFEPMLGSGGVRTMLQNYTPEFWPVVHMPAMGYFMGRDIIKDMARGEDQTPIVGEIT